MGKVFISYAREDEPHAAAIADHLDQLRSMGIAETWFDRGIGIGELWESRIEEEIDRSDVFLILVSHNYLAGGFVHDAELPMIERATRSGARAVPVVVEECAWRSHPFIGSLNAFDSGKRLEAPTTKTFARQAASLVEAVADLVERQPMVNRGDPQQTAVTASAKRVDETGLANKGSQLQTQLYVNAARDRLNIAVSTELPDQLSSESISWVSPLREEGYAEYRDGAFLGALRLDEFTQSLKEFWPARGPRWDALARVDGAGAPGVLLCEGKSYPEEMTSTCKARGNSRDRILESFARAQAKLGVATTPEAWMDPYYQLANRLAHVLWLRDNGISAWLVHLLFVDDPISPTSEGAWRRAMESADQEMGLSGLELPAASVCLPSLSRDLLA